MRWERDAPVVVADHRRDRRDGPLDRARAVRDGHLAGLGGRGSVSQNASS